MCPLYYIKLYSSFILFYTSSHYTIFVLYIILYITGANHTGRVNDQECWPGEGMFFGLNCSLKFPVNLVESPYSIISPNTAFSSQKLKMPFSLIMSYPPTMPTSSSSQVKIIDSVTLSDCKIHPDACLIKPAWVLYGNPYMLDRYLTIMIF